MVQTDDSARTDRANLVGELENEATDALRTALDYIRKRGIRCDPLSDGSVPVGWSQFLQEEDMPPSVTGTACILSSMLLCGQNKRSELVVSARDFILQQVRDDGGWTTPRYQQQLSLTLATCLALMALLNAEEPPSSGPVKDGINWLLQAQNTNGGWGCASYNTQSDVTATAYAMRTLARVASFYSESEAAIARGQKWLLEIKNPDHSWGRWRDKPGTLAHTSHAIEALLAAGESAKMHRLTQDWLIANYKDNRQFQDYLIVEIPNQGTARLPWSHVSCERALIALLKLNTSISEPVIVDSVREVLARQVNGTYWKVEFVTTPGAAWAIWEAVGSLRLFLDSSKREGPRIFLEARVAQLEEDVEKLRKEVKAIKTRLHDSSMRARIDRLLRWSLKPIPLLTIGTFFLVIGFVLLRGFLSAPDHADTIVGILGIIGLALTIYQVLDLIRTRSK